METKQQGTWKGELIEGTAAEMKKDTASEHVHTEP
jgi:hypothetical protein